MFTSIYNFWTLFHTSVYVVIMINVLNSSFKCNYNTKFAQELSLLVEIFDKKLNDRAPTLIAVHTCDMNNNNQNV